MAPPPAKAMRMRHSKPLLTAAPSAGERLPAHATDRSRHSSQFSRRRSRDGARRKRPVNPAQERRLEFSRQSDGSCIGSGYPHHCGASPFSRSGWHHKHHCDSVNHGIRTFARGHFPWLTKPRFDKSTEAVTAATSDLRSIGPVLDTQFLSGHVVVDTVGNTAVFGHRIPLASFRCQLPTLPSLASTDSEQRPPISTCVKSVELFRS